jgi:type I restriction enzyme S subunit
VKAVEGWETKRFDEFGTIYSGSTPSTAIRSFWDGDIVWVTPNDLSKLKTPYLSDSGKRITEKGLKGCSATLLPEQSLVMSSRAPIGYVALATVQFCTNQGCKTIRLKDAFHPDFVYYNVLFNIGKIKNLGEGTTFAEISKTALSSVELTFPSSKPEQTKIAEILSTVDRAIEQTEALIAKQQRIKTGLMQDLLTRGIDEHGDLRSEQTHQFKDSPLGRIPVEWDHKELGNVAFVTKLN